MRFEKVLILAAGLAVVPVSVWSEEAGEAPAAAPEAQTATTPSPGAAQRPGMRPAGHYPRTPPGYGQPQRPGQHPYGGYRRPYQQPAYAPPAARAEPEPAAAPTPTPAGPAKQHAHREGGGQASRREMIEVLERIEARLARIESLLSQFTF